ncbi:hypothetical protein ACI0FM_06165 [Paenochrobactrum sp. BZR 588]|uniref:hypothetical protein n=1 Tax=Paenochrobactrum TaxID=999488 RepID=UPI0035BC5B48
MRKIGLLLILLAGISGQAAQAATDSEVVAEMASQCWTLPDTIDYQTATAVFEVKYDRDGKLVDIATIEYRPVRKAGQLFAISALEAIQECANETRVRSRTIRVVMSYSAAKSNDPLNMKRR